MPGHFLNDSIIDFYFKYLGKDFVILDVLDPTLAIVFVTVVVGLDAYSHAFCRGQRDL